MPSYNTKQMLAELARETQEMLDFANELEQLTPEQMNWRPSPKKWSVAECLAHLNISAKHYLDRVEKAMNEAVPLATAPQLFKAGYWGEKLTTTIKPLPNGQIPSPMGAMSKFDPTKKERVNEGTLSTFVHYHQLMLDLINKAEKYDLQAIRITSALGPIIRFKLGDTFRFVVAHDQRHILQARRVIATVGFPK